MANFTFHSMPINGHRSVADGVETFHGRWHCPECTGSPLTWTSTAQADMKDEQRDEAHLRAAFAVLDAHRDEQHRPAASRKGK